MDQAPVTHHPVREGPSWTLTPEHAAKTQGLVVSGFNHLPWAQALFLRLDTPGGAWLQTIQRLAPVSDATGKANRATALAFTATGLARMGLGDALATFAAPFQEGMHQEDRRRRLGDDERTVIAGGPAWSGNAHDEPQTPDLVHALLLLYDASETDAASWADEVALALQPGAAVVRRIGLDLQLDERRLAREHFGFTDGLSQPAPYGNEVVLTNGHKVSRDRWHGIPCGDIVMGHANAHHEPAPGPYIPDPGPAARPPGLSPDGAPEGFLNFGLDGSYMVVRELRQYVAAFWQSLDQGAAAILARNPAATHVTPIWLAERIVGRDIDGHLLCPSGSMAALKNGQPNNGIGFIHNDPHSHGCPAGSHVRRANPRDGLAKDTADAQTLLDAANNHRILRRGRKYGPKVDDPRTDDQQDRGLLFMCLNTDLVRQFEFIQQTWLLNQNFATLFDETDPLVGPKGTFTISEKPLRRIVDVETFVKLAGGEYFFLPSLPALAYLATL